MWYENRVGHQHTNDSIIKNVLRSNIQAEHRFYAGIAANFTVYNLAREEVYLGEMNKRNPTLYFSLWMQNIMYGARNEYLAYINP